jgi:hypothetical protein
MFNSHIRELSRRPCKGCLCLHGSGLCVALARPSSLSSGSSREAATCTAQVDATSEDSSNLALSGAGLTARSKPSPVIQAQDAEPMYKVAAYSDGLPRRGE